MNLHTDALNKEPLRFNMYEVLKTLFSMYLSTNNTTTKNLQITFAFKSQNAVQKSAALLTRFSLIWRKRNEFIRSGHHTSHTGGPRGSVSDEAAGYQIVSHLHSLAHPEQTSPYSRGGGHVC